MINAVLLKRTEQGAQQPAWMAALPFDFAQLGYLLLAVAAGFALFDRFFGFSTAWMRFVSTQLEIERIRDAFRIEWIALDRQRGGDDRQELSLRYIKLVRSVLNASKEQTIRETRAWIAEFQTNLAQFEKEIRNQADAARAGAVDLVITDGQLADSVDVLLDALVAERITGTQASISNVSPGIHKVTARATVQGRSYAASQMVQVEPNSIATVELTLNLPLALPSVRTSSFGADASVSSQVPR